MADKVNTERLRQLSLAVTRGREGWSEFTMRVPADPDRDADLVLSSAANEIEALRAQLAEATKQRDETRDYAMSEASKLRAQLAARDAEVGRLREAYDIDTQRLKADIRTLNEHLAGNVWHWSATEDNHVESLVCPILISAKDLLDLLNNNHEQ